MGVIDYLIRRRVKALEDKAQVFEVTDLTIPAGTSSRSQVLGTFEIPPASLFLLDFYIESDTGPVVDPDVVGLTEGYDPDDLWESSGTAIFLPDTGLGVVAGNLTRFNIAHEDQVSSVTLGTFSNNTRRRTPLTKYVGITTGPTPMSRDIHIVRARAAFQVI